MLKATRFHHWILAVRENVTEYERAVLEAPPSRTSQDIHRLLAPRILSESVERMYAVALDGHNHVLAICEVARGGIHGCSVSARDILRPMIMACASGFIIVHNHPSGDPNPSTEDLAMTRTVKAAGEVVGVTLVDHVIIASMARYSSLLEMGLI